MKLATLPALVLLMLAMVIFNACSTASPSLTGEWQLVSYGDSAAPTPALPGVDTSISFEEGHFGGTVGCNSLGGEYTLAGDQLSIGPVISTMMFCEATSAQESAVLGILSEQELKISLTDSQLTLAAADGSSVIILARK